MEEFKYLIPEESIDAIMNNVSKLRDIENDLRHIFVEHGYLEVLMPSFEYVHLYNQFSFPSNAMQFLCEIGNAPLI